jgi:hypothetical protein
MATVSKWVVRVLLLGALGIAVYAAIVADWSLLGLAGKCAGAGLLWHWTEPIIQRQHKSQQSVDN